MLYSYKCEHCSKLMDIDMPMLEVHPKFVLCDCGYKSYRNFSTYKIKIPENFQSQSDLYNNNTAADFNYISDRMKHGVLPSGKKHAVY
jgi:hypothetical protein